MQGGFGAQPVVEKGTHASHAAATKCHALSPQHKVPAGAHLECPQAGNGRTPQQKAGSTAFLADQEDEQSVQLQDQTPKHQTAREVPAMSQEMDAPRAAKSKKVQYQAQQLLEIDQTLQAEKDDQPSMTALPAKPPTKEAPPASCRCSSSATAPPMYFQDRLKNALLKRQQPSQPPQQVWPQQGCGQWSSQSCQMPWLELCTPTLDDAMLVRSRLAVTRDVGGMRHSAHRAPCMDAWSQRVLVPSVCASASSTSERDDVPKPKRAKASRDDSPSGSSGVSGKQHIPAMTLDASTGGTAPPPACGLSSQPTPQSQLQLGLAPISLSTALPMPRAWVSVSSEPGAGALAHSEEQVVNGMLQLATASSLLRLAPSWPQLEQRCLKPLLRGLLLLHSIIAQHNFVHFTQRPSVGAVVVIAAAIPYGRKDVSPTSLSLRRAGLFQLRRFHRNAINEARELMGKISSKDVFIVSTLLGAILAAHCSRQRQGQIVSDGMKRAMQRCKEDEVRQRLQELQLPELASFGLRFAPATKMRQVHFEPAFRHTWHNLQQDPTFKALCEAVKNCLWAASHY